MPGSFLRDLLVAYGVGVIAVLALHRARIPALVGFVLAGALVGPHGLQLVHDEASVETLADVGVVVLLFSVGAEMSLGRLLRSGPRLLVAGALQMVLATGATAGIVRALGQPWPVAVVVGLVVAASSTTLVLTLLGQRGELDAPQGRLGTGILLFQDLCVIPILLLLPALGGGDGGPVDALMGLGKAAVLIGGTFVLARLLVPRLLEVVVATRSRELFALSVIVLCLGTAFLARLAGVPLALGAFLGGLVVSESPYAHHALGDLQPLRDGLSGLFFVGIGMLLDVSAVAAVGPVFLVLVVGIVLLKAVTTAAAVVWSGHGARVAALVGLSLAQIGEFSFVVAREAQVHVFAGSGAAIGGGLATLLMAGVVTMCLTPFLVRAAPAVANRVDRVATPVARAGTAGSPGPDDEPRGPSDHVVIVGFGLCGRNVALALSAHGIPCSVVEMNPETVRREGATGLDIRYGDAGHAAVLAAAGVARARALVVAISDAPSTRRVVAAARGLRRDLHVLVRTRYLHEVDDLELLGADEIVPEELETSVEIASRVLRHYRLPREAIERTELALRAGRAEPARGAAPTKALRAALGDAALHVELEMHVVGPGAPVDGKTIGDLALRRRHGVTIVGVRRGDQLLTEPDAETALAAGDVVVALGRPERLARCAALFRPPESAA